MKYLSWISVLLLASALPSIAHGATDPCSSAVKNSAAWDINASGFQEVILGVANIQIFAGSASLNFQMVFDAGTSGSGCAELTAGFGGLSYNNSAVVSIGGGSSTQFTVPAGHSLCIFFNGAAPLTSSGWVTYVQQR